MAYGSFVTFALLVFATFFGTGPALAQDACDEGVGLELGATGEWPLDGDRSNFGGIVGLDLEVIEHWLEIEAEFAALGTNGHPELEGELAFRKPFNLSQTVELEIGIGPSYERELSGADKRGVWGVELSSELYFYTFHDKRLAWFIEPSWSIAPSNGEKSIGVSVGISIGI